ncbi:hypothetical protein [Vagococcus lutrae]|uniref:hypothetical protein n=1 Tax=Vagococcus lutrae TaxID=81947 RepID=UPI00200F3C62|nr:hypothetical protein [Vagococcus lutrae]MDT2806515.1 hypothetical protein [Vagococcus lutrae]MDT2824983.1 hypothetical protein [Vagococcus lutrae]UQF18114.1 hypothetical protein M2905_05395 [Vagococcus lutrae]
MAITQNPYPIQRSIREGQELCFNWQKCDTSLKEKLVFILTRYFPILMIDASDTSSKACVLTDKTSFSRELPSLQSSDYLIIYVHSRKLYLDLFYFIQALEIEDMEILMMS